jgi:hypothetical protein
VRLALSSRRGGKVAVCTKFDSGGRYIRTGADFRWTLAVSPAAASLACCAYTVPGLQTRQSERDIFCCGGPFLLGPPIRNRRISLGQTFNCRTYRHRDCLSCLRHYPFRSSHVYCKPACLLWQNWTEMWWLRGGCCNWVGSVQIDRGMLQWLYIQLSIAYSQHPSWEKQSWAL